MDLVVSRATIGDAPDLGIIGPAAYAAAIAGGATPVAEPETMSWGQVVSYVQDPDGHLVELATTVGG